MTDTLRKVEYTLIPGNKHHSTRSILRFSFLSSVPSIDIDPNPLFYLDRMGNFQGCNKGFEQLIQRKRHEIIGKAVREIFLPETASCIQQHFTTMLNTPGTRNFLLPLTIPEAKVFLMTMTRSSVDLGEPIIISTLIDVTELPKAGREVDILDSKETCPYLELLMRSEKLKNQLLEWLGNLNKHLTVEGKAILSSIIKRFKRELCDEISLRSEKEFDDRHQGLYKFLEQTSAEITRNEMRLCALLSLNHSPTDIARLTCKSTNSVNVAFARIRSKLGLSNSKELKDFLTRHEQKNSNVIRMMPEHLMHMEGPWVM
jgi:DNA-binding CsgD family transcriptional regulator